MQLIKDSQLVDDEWHLLAEGEDPTSRPGSEPLLVEFSAWSELRGALLSRSGLIGVQLDGGDEVETLAEDLPKLQLITISFGAFVDGRGYSLAHLLRERFGYSGELRAVGDVLPDQAHLMAQVGINAFAVADGCDPQAFLQASKIDDVRQALRHG